MFRSRNWGFTEHVLFKELKTFYYQVTRLVWGAEGWSMCLTWETEGLPNMSYLRSSRLYIIKSHAWGAEGWSMYLTWETEGLPNMSYLRSCRLHVIKSHAWGAEGWSMCLTGETEGLPNRSYLRSCRLHIIKSLGLLGELKVDQCVSLEKLRVHKHVLFKELHTSCYQVTRFAWGAEGWSMYLTWEAEGWQTWGRHGSACRPWPQRRKGQSREPESSTGSASSFLTHPQPWLPLIQSHLYTQLLFWRHSPGALWSCRQNTLHMNQYVRFVEVQQNDFTHTHTHT